MVKKKLLLAVILVQFIMVNYPGYAQSGGCYGYGTGNTEEAHDVIETSNGDILVAGETNQNSKDAFLLKFTPDGSQTVQWKQAYGTTSNTEVAKAVVEHNGYYYITGYSKASDKDIFILKVDPSDGSVLNGKTLGGNSPDVANDIIVTQKGNLAITGQHKTTKNTNSILSFLMTFSMTQSNFTLHREFAYGTGSKNRGNALTQDSEGDFWVVGEDLNNNGSGLIWQIEENFTNNTQSDIIYEAIITDNNNFQSLNDIEEESNHVIATGTGKFGSISSNLNAKGAYAAKIDHTTSNPSNAYNNIVVRYQAFGTGNTERAYSLATTSSGYAFTGKNGNDKLLAFKIRKDFSNIKWDKVLGGSSTDRGNAIIQLSTGEFFSAGRTQSSAYNTGGENFFLTTLNSGGANCCASSTSLTRHTLDPQKSITKNPNNSSFAMDESRLSSNISNLNNFTTLNNTSSADFERGSGCGALPVEFAGFQLDQAGPSAVNIAWSTASETQNNYFTVLRSRSGDNFRPVGRRDGQGTKITSTEYTLVDDVPRLNAIYYYKIRQTDFDGSTSCSNIKAIELGKRSASDLSISHVTTQGNTLAAHLKGSAEGAQTVQLMNSLGQQVARQQLNGIKGEQSLQFNLNQRAQQMLYLRIIDQQTGELIANKKVVAATK
jgi:uncharacterized protein YpmB